MRTDFENMTIDELEEVSKQQVVRAERQYQRAMRDRRIADIIGGAVLGSALVVMVFAALS